jgi:hypothetical protein
MNRNQFLILVVALIVLGGAGAVLFWQDIAAYRASGAKIGGRLLPDFKVADVAQVRLQDGKNQTTLLLKDRHWVVEERGGYPADFKAIGDFIVKLLELKVTQSEAVGELLWPRVDLVAPGKGGEGVGTLAEFKDGSGKALASLVLGKQVLKKDPLNPLPGAQDGVPAGRYVRVSDARDKVIVVSDPLNAADAAPGKWLDKTFIKVDRVKTLAVGPEGAAPKWKIARDEEWGQWKFAGGAGNLNAGAAVGAVNALGKFGFSDIAVKPADAEKPTVIVAETFDNLTYTVKLARAGDQYRLKFSVAGEPSKARVPEKGEKPEDKERRDKDFAESRQQLMSRIELEKVLSNWTYIVQPSEVEAVLQDRARMVASKRPES